MSIRIPRIAGTFSNTPEEHQTNETACSVLLAIPRRRRIRHRAALYLSLGYTYAPESRSILAQYTSEKPHLCVRTYTRTSSRQNISELFVHSLRVLLPISPMISRRVRSQQFGRPSNFISGIFTWEYSRGTGSDRRSVSPKRQEMKMDDKMGGRPDLRHGPMLTNLETQ